VKVEVDGRPVEVCDGTTVLQAVHAAERALPTLCYDSRLSPFGACRVCLVSVGGRTVPACVTPAAEGDEIRTDDPRSRAAARHTLELIVSELPERALELSAERSELVRACALLGVESDRFRGERVGGGRDDSHPYVKLDRDLCIACGRCVRMCDEVQGTFALELVGRGFSTVVGPGSGGSWLESDCVACGGCVDSCPTGALSEPGFLELRPIERTVTTTCGYCGVGCALDVHVRDSEIAAVTPNHASPTSRGHSCVKGRFAHGFVRSDDRLTTPLVRRNGRLEPTGWDEALAFVGERLLEIRERHGPNAIASISSARATNEENYLVQKLMRAVIGTNNVDNCSRLCHSPSAAGLTASFGVSGGTNPFDDFDRVDCFLLAGSNPTEAHPVVGARLKQRVIQGASLVVVDPRRIELARYADVHLRPRPGGNVAVFNGLAHVLLEEGFADEAFLAERADGLDELRKVLRDHTPERVEQITGVPASELRGAARRYGCAGCSSIVYGLGITEHAHGTDGVRTLANLAILTGQVGTTRGGGVNPLRGQNNVQGASDMGALPDLLPGYQRVADNDEAVARAEREWGVELDRTPGLRILDMFAAALEGRLNALWVIGEDIAQTDPDTRRVEAAIDACELVISQELFLSRTAERADVVFPATSFFEKDGTFVNFDRRVQRVRTAVAPPGEAKTDFEIVNLVAAALGADLGCPTPAAAFNEMARIAPDFAGISHARLDAAGPIHWPCRSANDPGTPQLHLERFATASGKAQLAARPYLPPGEEPDADYPLVLITGRRLEHYNAGTMTRRTANLELLPEERLEVNPTDAARLGLRDAAVATVTSRRGSIQVTAEVTERVSPGQVFMAFHFPEAAANVLTSDANDEFTSCPEYKVSAVRLAPAGQLRPARSER
jgi:formate dehydrogenase major subunit